LPNKRNELVVVEWAFRVRLMTEIHYEAHHIEVDVGVATKWRALQMHICSKICVDVDMDEPKVDVKGNGNIDSNISDEERIFEVEDAVCPRFEAVPLVSTVFLMASRLLTLLQLGQPKSVPRGVHHPAKMSVTIQSFAGQTYHAQLRRDCKIRLSLNTQTITEIPTDAHWVHSRVVIRDLKARMVTTNSEHPISKQISHIQILSRAHRILEV
jgi:hypothetical protein